MKREFLSMKGNSYQLLHRLGYCFTVNGPKNRALPGRPDMVLPKRRNVVFIHGCFR